MSPTKYLTMKMSTYHGGVLLDACIDPLNGKIIAKKLRVHIIDDVQSSVSRSSKSSLLAHDVERLVAEGVELSLDCDKTLDPQEAL